MSVVYWKTVIFGNHSKESGGYFINSGEPVKVCEQGTELSNYSVCVCVCVCECACACVCVCARARVCVYVFGWSVVSDFLGPQVL